MVSRSAPICYLCGIAIDRNATEDQSKLSMDHVPPKQFFPKQIRIDNDLNLELAPSHKKCNNDYKDDEDYFYHSLYPLIANSNAEMAQAVFKDLARRSRNPQTPVMLRGIYSGVSRLTKGGTILPANKVEINVDLTRIQRVAGKVARGVLFLATQTYFPDRSIIDMRICESSSEVPEMYQLSWKATSTESAYRRVFSYKYLPYNGLHVLSLWFWEAFMFCVTIRDNEG